jgi:hypothetical protein
LDVPHLFLDSKLVEVTMEIKKSEYYKIGVMSIRKFLDGYSELTEESKSRATLFEDGEFIEVSEDELNRIQEKWYELKEIIEE